MGSAIAAGSTIALGDGNDTLLSVGGSVAVSTASATTVIDGGAGTDSIAASLINAAHAAQFKNFESLDLSAATTTALDAHLKSAHVATYVPQLRACVVDGAFAVQFIKSDEVSFVTL